MSVLSSPRIRSNCRLDRYFFRLDEIQSYLKTAGFRDIEHVHKINYQSSTEKRLSTEFGGDQSKLEAWNQYIRDEIDSMCSILTV